MFMMPELLAAMLSVEALEDNEVLKVEGVRLFSRINDKTQKSTTEILAEPKTVSEEWSCSASDAVCFQDINITAHFLRVFKIST